MWKQVRICAFVFMAFSCVVVALDTDIPIFGVQVLSFGTPGALIFDLGNHFVSSGASWGTMVPQEGHAGVRNQIFIGFETISGSHVANCLGSNGLNSIGCFSVLFPARYLH